MQGWLVAFVLLGAGLAGCSGEATDAPLATTSSPQEGAIAGLVVDEALRPLSGVAVRTQAGHAATTTAQGAFRFDALAPGAYLLSLNRTGFLPVQLPVQVEAGAVASPRVQLATAGVAKPYHDTFKFSGLAEASAGLATTVAGRAAGGLATCQCSFPFSASGGLVSILVEAAWEDAVPNPASPTKYTWQVTVDGSDAQASGQDPSPIRRELQRLDFSNRTFDFSAHPAYTLHVYPDAVWPAVNQEYTAFVTLWYLERPPADFSIVNGSPA